MHWWYPWLSDLLGVVIGVQQTMLTVSEGEPALVCVNLTLGTLARDVVVKLTTMYGTAIGKILACSKWLQINFTLCQYLMSLLGISDTLCFPNTIMCPYSLQVVWMVLQIMKTLLCFLHLVLVCSSSV